MPCKAQLLISIHAPREGGDDSASARTNFHKEISIHAPREGGDYKTAGLSANQYIFQSTPPARGATHPGKRKTNYCCISIHAPREGGDFVSGSRQL